MHYHALIEEWPNEAMIYFRELPGCCPAAATAEAALVLAPAAVAAHLEWLAAHGIAVANDGTIDVVVAERVAALHGRFGPCFAADLPPPADHEIERALRVASLARADLLRLYPGPPGPPGEWSVADHLRHIAEAERWYIAALNDPDAPWPAIDPAADPIAALAASAARAEAMLRGLTPDQRNRVVTRSGEEWTAAKVLRRLCGHLREHYPWVAALAQNREPRTENRG